MKKFELTLNGGSKYVVADSFKQAGSDITFYVEGACTGLVRLNNGDCIFQVETPDNPCPDCGYKPGERAEQKSASPAECYVKVLVEGARAVHSEQQGWLIVANDDTLNLACGFGQPDFCTTPEEAWEAALILQGLAARDRQLRKWPNAHAVRIGKVGWVVLGESEVTDRNSIAYLYPLAITHNCTFCTTEIGAWLNADERDAKGHPTWHPNRFTGGTSATDEHNSMVDSKADGRMRVSL